MKTQMRAHPQNRKKHVEKNMFLEDQDKYSNNQINIEIILKAIRHKPIQFF